MLGHQMGKLSYVLIATILSVLIFSSSYAKSLSDHYSDVPHKSNQHRFKIVSAYFVPNKQRILIQYRDYGWGHQSGVYSMDYSGNILKDICLGSKRYYCRTPSVSPNGQYLAVGVGRGGKGLDIIWGDLDNSYVKPLTNDPLFEGFWVFSQDSKRLYFVRFKGMPKESKAKANRYRNGDIYFVDIDSNKEYPIALNQYRKINYFSVFPDERHYLISTDKYKNEGSLLWKVNVNDHDKRVAIVPDLTPYAEEPRAKGWVSKRVARKEGNISIEGNNIQKPERRLAPIRFYDIRRPILSSDGKWLVFSWSVPRSYRYDLFITKLATMNTIKLDTPPGNIIPLAISQDNQLILFSSYQDKPTKHGYERTANYWMINCDGTGLKKINPDFSEYYKKYPHRRPNVQIKSQPTN